MGQRVGGRARAHLRTNAIAYAALFFALTGTAAALPGTDTVFSDDITNGEVKDQDIGAEEVKAEDIDPFAFSTVDFKAPAGLPAFQIADDAIQGSEIQNGQVTGADVAAGTLTRADTVASAEAPAGFSFSDDATGGICNSFCTEGTLGSIPAGSYAVFGKVQLFQTDHDEPRLDVTCRLASSGNTFDEADISVTGETSAVAGTPVTSGLSLRGVRTFGGTGDVSINCKDGDLGDVGGGDLKLVAIRLGTVD